MLNVFLKPLIPRQIKRYLKVPRSRSGAFRQPRLCMEPAGQRVLVLAPHPDDEVIGCGGTLCKHARAGHEVTVVYMTDGSKGDPLLYEGQLPAPEAALRSQELVLRRQQEARQAGAILGVQELVFLGYPDLELRLSNVTQQALAAILLRVKPDVVYLPFATDTHPDHQATNRIFAAAVKHTRVSCTCYGYEVWTPLPVTLAVDISDVVDVKTAALQQYQSQLAYADWLRASLSLNSYRAISVRAPGTHVEALYEAPVQAYIRLVQRLGTDPEV